MYSAFADALLSSIIVSPSMITVSNFGLLSAVIHMADETDAENE
jgi:hypothetical protein